MLTGPLSISQAQLSDVLSDPVSHTESLQLNFFAVSVSQGHYLLLPWRALADTVTGKLHVSRTLPVYLYPL
jgi:hypothetical protein